MAVLLGISALPVRGEILELPKEGNSVVGAMYQITTAYGETTPVLAQAHEVGYHELLWANPNVHSWMPGEGAQLRIPRQYILPGDAREGIVLNIAELRLYFYDQPEDGPAQVRSYPVSIGRIDWVTPLGQTKIVDRLENPNWYPPASVRLEHQQRGDELPRIVGPGPDNPLGQYALMLETPGYFIHGTNREEGIGMRVTHGCIRMRSQDILELIYKVNVGTPVQILSMPIKVGILDGVVYLEVHTKPLEEFPVAVAEPVMSEADISAPLAALEEQLPAGDYVIYWDRVMEVARRKHGVPEAIGWSQTVSPAPPDQPELLWRVEAPPAPEPEPEA